MGYFDSSGKYRKTAQAFMPVNIRTFHLAAGTPLAAFANGASATPGIALDDSEAAGVRWNDNGTLSAIWGAVDLPSDRKPGSDVIVHIKASKTGATLADAVTFVVGAFFQPVAALRDADATAGGTSSAMTGNATSKRVQKVTRTIAAADIPDPSTTDPCATMSMSLVPTALTVDDVTIHSVELEYTRQDLAE
jgi:hypothetical protein